MYYTKVEITFGNGQKKYGQTIELENGFFKDHENETIHRVIRDACHLALERMGKMTLKDSFDLEKSYSELTA